MDHKQKRHDRHEHERKLKQMQARQREADFSKPNRASIWPVWFLVIGIVGSLIALFIWMRT